MHKVDGHLPEGSGLDVPGRPLAGQGYAARPDANMLAKAYERNGQIEKMVSLYYDLLCRGARMF